MKSIFSIFLIMSLVLVNCVPVLSADSRSLTILYSGDTRGYVLPCAT